MNSNAQFSSSNRASSQAPQLLKKVIGWSILYTGALILLTPVFA